MIMSKPESWSDEDWYDFEEYLQGLDCQEFKDELKFMEMLGKAKKSGKNVVVIDHYYDM
jgi:hypothetical protein